MSKQSFVVALCCGMLALLFACTTTTTIEDVDGRAHNVSRERFMGITTHYEASIIKTDAELAADAKEATALLKSEMERKLALAKADALAAMDRARSFETRIGTITKLMGFGMIALGMLGHCFVSAPHLRSIASSVICGGACVVVVGVLIKWSVGWELAVLLCALAIGIPILHKLRNKGWKRVIN